MTKTAKMNFPNDVGYKRELWRCPNIDTQSHIQTAQPFEHLRAGNDLDNDQDMVKYFQQVIALRESDDEME